MTITRPFPVLRCAKSIIGFSIRNTVNDSRYPQHFFFKWKSKHLGQTVPYECNNKSKHVFQAEHLRREEYNRKMVEDNEKEETKEATDDVEKEVEATDDVQNTGNNVLPPISTDED